MKNIPLKIVLIYLLVGVIWVLLSDTVILAVTRNADELTTLQNIKDILFIAATALLFYFLMNRYYQRLGNSEQQYRQLFQDNPQPMWIYRRDNYKILAVNEAAVHKYGYTRKEFMSMTIREIRPEEDIPLLEQTVQEAMSHNGLNNDLVFRHRKKSGEIFYVQISSQKTLFNNEPVRLVVALDIDEKYKADQKALALNQQLQDILENMTDGFFALDKNWHYILLNTAFERILDLKRENLLGRRLQEGQPELLQMPYYEQIQNVMHKGQSTQIEIQYNRQRNWLQLRLYPFSDGICAFFSDITQRKQDEAVLKLALERYEIVAKATNHVIYDWDLEQNKVSWNHSGLQVLNYQPHEVAHTIEWWENHIHPQDKDIILTGLYQTIQDKKEHWEAKYRLLCGNKEYRYFYERGYLLYSEEGEPKRMIGALQDIHQEKLYQEEINKLSLVARKTRSGVIITDKNGLTEWVNDGFTRMMGYSLEEMMSKKPGDMLQGAETTASSVQFIHNKLQQQIDFSAEVINYHKNGNLIWVRMDISPIFDEEGTLIKFIGITTEITERKQFEKKLKQQNEQLKEIAWISSHDVRRPVASILGLISLYDKETPPQDFNAEILTHLGTCAHELDEVIRKIVFKSYEVSNLNEEIKHK